MDAYSFTSFVNQIAPLNRAQCKHVLALLTSTASQARTVEVIEEAAAVTLCCPRCQGTQLYRHGTKSGLQRFRCRACGRTFNSLSGTPLARLRKKEEWIRYCECMLDSRTIRKAAARVEVDKNTSLRWRPRFLALNKTDRPTRLIGIAQVDETFLLESKKGARKLDRPARKRGGRASRRGISQAHVCMLVARDRTGQTCDCVTGPGNCPIISGGAGQLTRSAFVPRRPCSKPQSGSSIPNEDSAK